MLESKRDDENNGMIKIKKVYFWEWIASAV